VIILSVAFRIHLTAFLEYKLNIGILGKWTTYHTFSVVFSVVFSREITIQDYNTTNIAISLPNEQPYYTSSVARLEHNLTSEYSLSFNNLSYLFSRNGLIKDWKRHWKAENVWLVVHFCVSIRNAKWTTNHTFSVVFSREIRTQHLGQMNNLSYVFSREIRNTT